MPGNPCLYYVALIFIPLASVEVTVETGIHCLNLSVALGWSIWVWLLVCLLSLVVLIVVVCVAIIVQCALFGVLECASGSSRAGFRRKRGIII